MTVSRDPVYVVTATAARPKYHPAPRRRPSLSPAEHIVLSQRYSARNAAPNKDNGDAEPPLGYRLSRRTRMSLDVYNFTSTSRTVTVKAASRRGLVGTGGRSGTGRGPAPGPYDGEVHDHGGQRGARRTDHRLEFTATLDGDEVPSSVS